MRNELASAQSNSPTACSISVVEVEEAKAVFWVTTRQDRLLEIRSWRARWTAGIEFGQYRSPEPRQGLPPCDFHSATRHMLLERAAGR